MLEQQRKYDRVLGVVVAAHEIAERDAEGLHRPRRTATGKPAKLGFRAWVVTVAHGRAHPAQQRDVAADPLVQLNQPGQHPPAPRHLRRHGRLVRMLD